MKIKLWANPLPLPDNTGRAGVGALLPLFIVCFKTPHTIKELRLSPFRCYALHSQHPSLSLSIASPLYFKQQTQLKSPFQSQTSNHAVT